MTRQEIEALLRILRPDRQYCREASGERSHIHQPSCRARALADPALGWNLARSYAEAGLRLPSCGVPLAVVRANGFLLELEPLDINVALAQMLNLPQTKPQRDLLRALLICEGSTVEGIAEFCHLDPDVVRLFEGLFWNCLDRKAERLYLARICQQLGASGREDQRALEDPGLTLLRIALQTGRAELVMAVAGVAPAKDQIPIQVLYQQIHEGILSCAAAAVAPGQFTGIDNPSIKSALKIIARQKQKRSEQNVTSEVSIEEAIQLVFDKVRGPKADYEI